MNEKERESIIIKRLIGTFEERSELPNNDICDCEQPAPYRPEGLCAPMFPINHCLVCGGFCN